MAAVEPTATDDPARAVRRLHTALALGQLMLAGVLEFVRRQTGVLIDDLPAIGLWMAGLSAMTIAVAALVLRPRVPRREPNVAAPVFWNQHSMNRVIQLWVVLEGATVFALVAYFLTGVVPAILVAAAGVLIFAFVRPAYFESR
ncbi:MAG TPA: hypothetical protein VFO19_01765 [Vicinamibacterales bacterium]|nr:hypothetical protein [Vicinamibacterales bacterium]